MDRIITAAFLQPEFKYVTSRSSGPGGQNVNKVNTKVALQFDVMNSGILNDAEKEIIFSKLASKITGEGILVVTSQDKRSQLENKENALLKFDKLLKKAFEKKKKRKATKPTKSSKQERIKAKKQHSEKKQWRQKLT